MKSWSSIRTTLTMELSEFSKLQYEYTYTVNSLYHEMFTEILKYLFDPDKLLKYVRTDYSAANPSVFQSQ
ncbi:unnamed protein product [Schistocephalus solidus]|uniref:Transposase n=1 Tax=Schistocephalus solidus TaxID=70667 RepID=A0A183SZZ1_SCHSO|nr:unnamed protein product [Schistocephalus solidus]